MNRGVIEQIPRSALALMLLSQAVVIAPHVPRMAPWTLAFWGACVLWRISIYQGRWNYPGTWTKGAFVILAIVGVGMSHGIQFSLEPAVALLILALALKLLEMRTRRDALVVIYLGYFVIATQFLFEQSIAITLYQLIAVVTVTGALVALHQSWNRPHSRASLRTAAVILLQAVPLTIVIFVFFPRIAPLWAVPMPESSATTGLSETLTPGSITQLGRSSELAFRVEFEERTPAMRTLYWRVITYSEYEEGTWTPGSLLELRDPPVHWTGGGSEPAWLREVQPEDRPIRYSIVAEPTFQPWLFALDFARPLTRGTGIGRDFRVLHRGPVTQRFRYEVESRPARLDLGLSEWHRLRETALPERGNPRTRQFVAELAGEHPQPRALADALMRHFATQPFFYTLNPPPLGRDGIDAFLFETRRGFCGHYASAFVYAMRLAGIPARVVGGYQGGEYNPVGDYVAVRQYDAHAWAEIWIDGEGWVRYDPTMAVAPDRIELGAQAAFAGNAEEAAYGRFTGQSLWRRFDWLAEAYYFIDSLQHRWNVFVVSYDTSRQNRFLRDLLGELTPMRVGLAAGAAAGVAVLIALLGGVPGILARRRPPLLRFHDAFARLFERTGSPRHPSETPGRYARRLALRYPEVEEDVEVLGARLEDALFGPQADDNGDLPEALDSRFRLLRLKFRLMQLRLRRAFNPRGDDRGRLV